MSYVTVILSNGAFNLYQYFPKYTESNIKRSLHVDEWQEIWHGHLGEGRIIQPFYLQSNLNLLAIGEVGASNSTNANIFKLIS